MSPRGLLLAAVLMAALASPASAEGKTDVRGNCNALGLAQNSFALTVCVNFPVEAFAAQLRQREEQIRAEETGKRAELERTLSDARERTGEQRALIERLNADLSLLRGQSDAVKAQLSDLDAAYKAHIAELERRYQEVSAASADADPARLAAALAALERGQSGEADRLFAEIAAADKARGERAARALFERGKIADGRIDWRAAAVHFRAAADRAPENGEYQGRAASALLKVGDARLAEGYAQKAVRRAEADVEKDPVPLAGALYYHAWTLTALAQYADAEPLYRRAQAIMEKSLGLDHPYVATTLNSLADLLRRRDNLEEAEPLARRALAIREKALGPNHPYVATTLDNLAGLLTTRAKLDEAEPLYRRALAIKEKALGPDHPYVAATLNNLAILLRIRDKLDEAEPLDRRALAIREKELGREHPDVATTLNNLAVLLEKRGNLDEAEPLYRRALAIRQKALGLDHPDFAMTLHNLAGLLESLGKLDEAEPLYRRALAIKEKALGPDHSDVAKTLNNLAGLLRTCGKLDKAEPLYRRARTILRAAFPAGHPDLKTVEENYASLRAKRSAKP